MSPFAIASANGGVLECEGTGEQAQSRARGFWAVLLAVLGVAQANAVEPSVLRYTYTNWTVAGPSPAFYDGTALTIEATLFRTNEILGAVTALTLPYDDGFEVVASISISSTEENGDGVALSFKPGNNFCCSYAVAAATVPMRVWTHIAATLDGTTARLYLGGVEIANAPISAMPPATANIVAYRVGHGFPGAIRDARVWTRALTPEEIADSAAGTMPPTAGLAADWAMDDGAGQQAADSGPNSIPLVLGDSASIERSDPHWITEAFMAEGPYFELKRVRRASIPASFEPMALDINLDGRLDLFYVGGLQCPVMTCTEPYYSGDPPEQLPPLRSNGDGTLTEDASLVDYEQLAGGFRYILGEFTGDSFEDVFVIDSGPEVWWCGLDCGPPGVEQSDAPGGRPRLFVGTAQGKLVEESSTRFPDLLAFTHGGAGGDIDGDGDLDVYFPASNDWELDDCKAANFSPGLDCPKILLNDGTGHFVDSFDRLPLEVSTRPEGSPYQAPVGCASMLDADRDHDLDIYLCRPGGTPLDTGDVILVNDGTGHFVVGPSNAFPERPGGNAEGAVDTLTGDLNRDGVDDIITMGSSKLALYWANGDGTYRAGPPEFHGREISHDNCRPRDLNDDGWPDLTCLGGIGPRFFYNLGNEHFLEMPFDYDYGPPFEGDLGRVDDDALLDVLIGSADEYQFLRQVKPYFPPNAVGVFANGFESDETSSWASP